MSASSINAKPDQIMNWSYIRKNYAWENKMIELTQSNPDMSNGEKIAILDATCLKTGEIKLLQQNKRYRLGLRPSVIQSILSNKKKYETYSKDEQSVSVSASTHVINMSKKVDEKADEEKFIAQQIAKITELEQHDKKNKVVEKKDKPIEKKDKVVEKKDKPVEKKDDTIDVYKKIVDDNMNCDICFELMLDAVLLTCCGNSMCKQCSLKMKRCSSCNSTNFKTVKNIAISRIIDNIIANSQDKTKDTKLHITVNVNNNAKFKVAIVKSTTFMDVANHIRQTIHMQEADSIRLQYRGYYLDKNKNVVATLTEISKTPIENITIEAVLYHDASNQLLITDSYGGSLYIDIRQDETFKSLLQQISDKKIGTAPFVVNYYDRICMLSIEDLIQVNTECDKSGQKLYTLQDCIGGHLSIEQNHHGQKIYYFGRLDMTNRPEPYYIYTPHKLDKVTVIHDGHDYTVDIDDSTTVRQVTEKIKTMLNRYIYLTHRGIQLENSVTILFFETIRRDPYLHVAHDVVGKFQILGKDGYSTMHGIWVTCATTINYIRHYFSLNRAVPHRYYRIRCVHKYLDPDMTLGDYGIEDCRTLDVSIGMYSW
ncbi:MAG: hypothetical protein Faunusvirus5_8 [Faunusvirus sp.]|uniref:RING-type domain-containing protein n=1 Tax=Faunusvirus sp. TaxID=2487766 RepID=A0A3G5A131_9VIRU|nr:MAG: hypothetical protein Faunusvirus5_8 [Faunusvirus sp.]